MKNLAFVLTVQTIVLADTGITGNISPAQAGRIVSTACFLDPPGVSEESYDMTLSDEAHAYVCWQLRTGPRPRWVTEQLRAQFGELA